MITRTPGIRPVPSLARRMDAVARASFPIVSTVVLLLLLEAPLFLPGQPAMRPAAALACVFFWTAHRPASMSPVAAFVIGLLADVLGDGPIGVTMVALLACQGIVLRWRFVLGAAGFSDGVDCVLRRDADLRGDCLELVQPVCADAAAVVAGVVPGGAGGRVLSRAGAVPAGRASGGLRTPSRPDGAPRGGPTTRAVFTRRAIGIAGLQTGVLGLLAAKLYQVQVEEGRHYALLARGNAGDDAADCAAARADDGPGRGADCRQQAELAGAADG